MSAGRETELTIGETRAAWAKDAAETNLTLVEALRLARHTVTEVTGLPIDGIAECAAQGEGWRIVIEVIESPARMGENDLLAAHEVTLTQDGALTGFSRLARYRREEGRSP